MRETDNPRNDMENMMPENFPILIDVEENAVGSVLRVLNRTPGILNIHLQLANSASTAAKQLEQRAATSKSPLAAMSRAERYQKRSQLGSDGIGIRGLICESLKTAPLHLNVLRAVLERRGYSNKGLHSAITKMLMDKYIIRTAPGTYRLAARGKKTYLNNPAHNLQRHGLRLPNNQAGIRLLTLTQLTKGSMSKEDVKNFYVNNGYSDSNIYNVLIKLREEGFVQLVGDQYEITERGRDAITPVVEESVVAETEHKYNGDAA